MNAHICGKNVAVLLITAVLLALTGACRTPDGPNNPPYPVTGAKNTPLVTEDASPVYVAGTSNEQSYYLFIEQEGGEDDPDGDMVYFRSDTPLPAYMILDENSGVLTITSTSTVTSGTTFSINFWSEDENGADTEDQSFEVTFTFIGS